VASVVDMIMAIVYREHGAGFFNVRRSSSLHELSSFCFGSLQAYEKEVRAREGVALRHELEDMFQRLRDDDAPLPLAPAQDDDDDEPPRPARDAAPKKKQPPKRPAPKAAVPSPKKPKKVAEKLTPAKRRRRQLRENVQNSHFALNTLSWSPWRRAMTLDEPPASSGNEWAPRRGDEPGCRNVGLFADKSRSKAAVYELAVQTGARRKLHVVFFACASSIPAGVRWDKHLIRHLHIHKMISKILEQKMDGCQIVIWARRAFLPKRGVVVDGQRIVGATATTNMLKACYDYAWRRCADRKRKVRTVVKDGCTISEMNYHYANRNAYLWGHYW
jgi:hypothetical protein